MIYTTLFVTISLQLLLVASPSPLPPTDLCKEASNTDCINENDPLMAVAISMNDNRFESAKEALRRTGFTVMRRRTPLHHDDPNLQLKFMDATGINSSSLPQNDRIRKYASLTVAFFDILKAFSMSQGDMRQWLYIFEDDIAIHNSSIPSASYDIKVGNIWQ